MLVIVLFLVQFGINFERVNLSKNIKNRPSRRVQIELFVEFSSESFQIARENHTSF